MNKKTKASFFIACASSVAFVAWTVMLLFVDVKPIGPDGSAVGFAALNGFVHNLTGVHYWLYTLTDWLGIIPIAVAFGFAILGLIQLIRRKSILKVDRSILALGAFYVAVIAVYVLFEILSVNFRPVLIEGRLEASYPSSTTVLAICVMISAKMQLKARIKNAVLNRIFCTLFILFTVFMVGARLACGVHWVSDVIGGILISLGLVMLYNAFGKFELNTP